MASIKDVSVLIVDDEPSFLELATHYLEDKHSDIEVFTRGSAGKALEVYSNFDCIVSDYQMPGMDGLDFLREVRENRGSDIPFIIFTGRGREEVAMEALNLGADRYIQKGGDPSSQFGILARAIFQTVEHYRTKQGLREREERYRRLFESSQTGIIIIERDNQVVQEANPYAHELLGFRGSELEGIDIWSLFHSSEKDKRRFRRDIGYLSGRLEDMVLQDRSGGKVYVDYVGNQYSMSGVEILQCSFIDINERKRAEEAFSRLAENILGNEGQELYDNVVKEVCEYFDADFTNIGVIKGGMVKSLSTIIDGEYVSNFSYELTGTPCEEVAMKGPTLYSEGVQEEFPGDRDLKELGMTGYAGVPIKNRSGKLIGVLCLTSREKLEMPRYWKEALKIISNRVSTEIDRIKV